MVVALRSFVGDEASLEYLDRDGKGSINGSSDFASRVMAVAFMPAALGGLLLADYITRVLFNPTVVASALILGGIALWLTSLESAHNLRTRRTSFESAHPAGACIIKGPPARSGLRLALPPTMDGVHLTSGGLMQYKDNMIITVNLTDGPRHPCLVGRTPQEINDKINKVILNRLSTANIDCQCPFPKATVIATVDVTTLKSCFEVPACCYEKQRKVLAAFGRRPHAVL